MSSRPWPLLVGGAAVLLVAALTHLLVILLLPRFATRDAYDLLSANNTPGHMIELPPAQPGESTIPFRDPAAAQGFCVFDLSKGPVRVKTDVEDGRLLTISFRSRDGKIFYSMTDRAAFHHTIDIHLVTAQQMADIEATDDDDRGIPDELRLLAPKTKGLIVATALAARPSERANARERIRAIHCATEPLPAAS